MTEEILKAYQKCLNNIDDYFKYRYLQDRVDKIQDTVMKHINNLTEELKSITEENNESN